MDEVINLGKTVSCALSLRSFLQIREFCCFIAGCLISDFVFASLTLGTLRPNIQQYI